VTVSVGDEASPATITRLLPGAASGGGQDPLADFAADREYADWRTDVLNLTSTRDVTYLGWLNQEGQRRVGLLRGVGGLTAAVHPLPATSFELSSRELTAWIQRHHPGQPTATSAHEG